jgi:hypothetical protein
MIRDGLTQAPAGEVRALVRKSVRSRVQTPWRTPEQSSGGALVRALVRNR